MLLSSLQVKARARAASEQRLESGEAWCACETPMSAFGG